MILSHIAAEVAHASRNERTGHWLTACCPGGEEDVAIADSRIQPVIEANSIESGRKPQALERLCGFLVLKTTYRAAGEPAKMARPRKHNCPTGWDARHPSRGLKEVITVSASRIDDILYPGQSLGSADPTRYFQTPKSYRESVQKPREPTFIVSLQPNGEHANHDR